MTPTQTQHIPCKIGTMRIRALAPHGNPVRAVAPVAAIAVRRMGVSSARTSTCTATRFYHVQSGTPTTGRPAPMHTGERRHAGATPGSSNTSQHRALQTHWALHAREAQPAHLPTTCTSAGCTQTGSAPSFVRKGQSAHGHCASLRTASTSCGSRSSSPWTLLARRAQLQPQWLWPA